MRGNRVEMQVTAGGTGAVTLAAVTGQPSLQNLMGSSGVRLINYLVVDGDNGEGGWAVVDLSTGVMTRGEKFWSRVGSTYNYHPSSNLNVTTAAKVVCGPQVHDAVPPPPGFDTSPSNAMTIGTKAQFAVTADGVWTAGAGSIQPPAGAVVFCPFKWTGRFKPTHLIWQQTALGAAGGFARAAFYDCRADVFAPGKRLFADDTEVDLATATGFKTHALGGALDHLCPGWYFTALAVNATAGTAVRVGNPANWWTHEGQCAYHSSTGNENAAFRVNTYDTWANVGDDPAVFTNTTSRGCNLFLGAL